MVEQSDEGNEMIMGKVEKQQERMKKKKAEKEKIKEAAVKTIEEKKLLTKQEKLKVVGAHVNIINKGITKAYGQIDHVEGNMVKVTVLKSYDIKLHTVNEHVECLSNDTILAKKPFKLDDKVGIYVDEGECGKQVGCGKVIGFKDERIVVVTFSSLLISGEYEINIPYEWDVTDLEFLNNIPLKKISNPTKWKGNEVKAKKKNAVCIEEWEPAKCKGTCTRKCKEMDETTIRDV